MNLHNGDCLEVLKTLEDNSIDSIVTDPPYGLAFMGKKWDYDVPSTEIWKECLRVLKPGGHLLSFGGTRTYHRMVVAIEDAGFEIRDQIQWIYGSGFPKSMNISKALSKINTNINSSSIDVEVASNLYRGWGTALKPANEPICLARKPIIEKTVTENVIWHGTGALNIDGCRIEGDPWKSHKATGLAKNKFFTDGEAETILKTPHAQGRWPANVILGCACEPSPHVFADGTTEQMHDEDCALAVMDGQSGSVKGSKASGLTQTSARSWKNTSKAGINRTGYEDNGGASRFFYCAKASKSERNAGLEGMPESMAKAAYGNRVCSECGKHELQTNLDRRCQCENPSWESARLVGVKNFHPTVKPIKLMEYLCKLITPPNGTVLDPFMGSGTTGVAATKLNYNFVGIEREKEYYDICVNRIKNNIKKPEDWINGLQ